MSNSHLRRYLAESQRLSLCDGMVACWAPPAFVVEYELPVRNLRGPYGLVEVDVEKLRLARDVSVN
jgi:hypothetical protein